MYRLDKIYANHGIRFDEAMSLAGIKEREKLSDLYETSEMWRFILSDSIYKEEYEEVEYVESRLEDTLKELRVMCDEICANCAEWA